MAVPTCKVLPIVRVNYNAPSEAQKIKTQWHDMLGSEYKFEIVVFINPTGELLRQLSDVFI